ncbi:MAG: DMT family transporter [Pseudomonadota bacterium]
MASFWILLASLLFSLMGVGVKLASSACPISEIVLVRGLIGVALLGAMVRHRGGSLRTGVLAAHLWRGISGVVSLWLWFLAIASLPLATAVTLNYMSPVWTACAVVVAGWWWQTGKRLEWPLLAAIGLSFAGVTLVLRPAFAAEQWSGALMALASGMLASLSYVLVRRMSREGEPGYRVVFYFSLVNVLAGALGMLFDGAAVSLPGWRGAALLVAVGVSGTVAQMALTRAYRTGKTLVVANLQYSGIIFSSSWGILIWGDRFDWHVWLGMFVIMASGLAATFYNLRRAAL